MRTDETWMILTKTIRFKITIFNRQSYDSPHTSYHQKTSERIIIMNANFVLK
jgi:hypothetical protein